MLLGNGEVLSTHLTAAEHWHCGCLVPLGVHVFIAGTGNQETLQNFGFWGRKSPFVYGGTQGFPCRTGGRCMGLRRSGHGVWGSCMLWNERGQVQNTGFT